MTVRPALKNNCLVVAGEASGEEHCLSFLPQLCATCPDLFLWGVGGDRMAAAGVELVYHLKDFSTWGYSEALRKIPFYLKAVKRLKKLVCERQAKVAILIDFQEFNLILAKSLSKMGVRILYYVAPQAWAWKSWRVATLKKSVHTLFTILPFERNWFAKRGLRQVVGVPHPVWVRYQGRYPKGRRPIPEKGMRLLLLPGSRQFEVELLLPVFAEVVRQLRQRFFIQVSLVYPGHLPTGLYGPYRHLVDTFYEDERLEQALQEADLALASNGTVTLTCALFGLPTVAVYRTGLFNEFIYNTFIHYKGYTALANIVHGEEVFPELLQDRATSFNIQRELLKWLEDEPGCHKIRDKLAKTGELLGGEVSDCGELIGKLCR